MFLNVLRASQQRKIRQIIIQRISIFVMHNVASWNNPMRRFPHHLSALPPHIRFCHLNEGSHVVAAFEFADTHSAKRQAAYGMPRLPFCRGGHMQSLHVCIPRSESFFKPTIVVGGFLARCVKVSNLRSPQTYSRTKLFSLENAWRNHHWSAALLAIFGLTHVFCHSVIILYARTVGQVFPAYEKLSRERTAQMGMVLA